MLVTIFGSWIIYKNYKQELEIQLNDSNSNALLLLNALKNNAIDTFVILLSFFCMWSLCSLCLYHYFLSFIGQTTSEHLRSVYNSSNSNNPYNLGLVGNCIRICCSSVPPSKLPDMSEVCHESEYIKFHRPNKFDEYNSLALYRQGLPQSHIKPMNSTVEIITNRSPIMKSNYGSIETENKTPIKNTISNNFNSNSVSRSPKFSSSLKNSSSSEYADKPISFSAKKGNNISTYNNQNSYDNFSAIDIEDTSSLISNKISDDESIKSQSSSIFSMFFSNKNAKI